MLSSLTGKNMGRFLKKGSLVSGTSTSSGTDMTSEKNGIKVPVQAQKVLITISSLIIVIILIIIVLIIKYVNLNAC